MKREGDKNVAKRDYYEVLGIDKNANDDEIKRAYRKLAKKYHPDLNQGDKQAEAMFKEVNEAYKVLSNPETRARYDRFGHAGAEQNGFGGGFGGFEGFDETGFGDIFDMFFGGTGFTGSRRRRNGPRKGADIRYDLDITFEEAAFGTKKTMKISKMDICGNCNGTGAKSGTEIEVCPKCDGTGEYQQVQSTPFGRFVNIKTCDKCHGAGKIIKEPCDKCHGKGKVRATKKISINIPAGIDSGQAITIREQGEPGEHGGPPGDLYVYINVKPHNLFERQGNDVYCEIPITFAQAALGTELEIPTLDGKIKFKIPEGTQTGTTFKIKNKGIPSLRGYGRGDQFINVKISVPKKLNHEQKELLKKFEEATSGKEIYEERKTFFKKMKDVFGV
ncbi:MAG: molecular chaperone DnaJ [Clostridia bacterium]|nr:molecular chaperone DnaJ [Clostridia bacterium]